MDIAMIIDAVILVFLGVTIFYAWRLSSYMKIFRDSRKDMEALLLSLDKDIARAEQSVLGMRNAAESAGLRLNEIIKDSRFLADELNFMNEAGDGLATRLEKLAEANRALVDKLEAAGGVTPNAPFRAADEAEEEDDLPGQRGLFGGGGQAARPANQSAGPAEPSLSSQAERELYEALQRKRGGR